MMLRVISAGILSVFLFMGSARADAFTDGALRFIENLAHNSLVTLTEKNIQRAERHRRFRVLLKDNFAVKTIARWVLGRYWRKATAAQHDEYFKLFENLIVLTYADRFAKLSGTSLRVKRAASKGSKDTVVYSVFDTGKPNGRKAKINWRLRAKGGKFRIIDVMVEGISMGQTQRAEFASVIRKNGGKIEGLLVELRKKK